MHILLFSLLAASPSVSVVTHCEGDGGCALLDETLRQAAAAEGLGLVDGGVWELSARPAGNTVFFELRSDAGVQLIAHTDELHYREPHRAADLGLLFSAITLVTLPIALDLHSPTSDRDRQQAWSLVSRRMLKNGVTKGTKSWGPTEARGQKFVVRFSAPRVLRHPVLEDGEVLVSDSDFDEVSRDSDEGREAQYSVSQLLGEFVRELDGAEAVDLGPGTGTLFVQMVNGHFRNTQLRDNPALLKSIPFGGRRLVMAVPFPLVGATRVLVPFQVSRVKAGATKPGR